MTEGSGSKWRAEYFYLLVNIYGGCIILLGRRIMAEHTIQAGKINEYKIMAGKFFEKRAFGEG